MNTPKQQKTLYKLTSMFDKTGPHRECQWGEGVTHKAPTRCPSLCTDGWIHAYRDPLLAILMDPIQGIFTSSLKFHLWLAEGTIGADDGTKVGCRTLTTLKRAPIPTVTPQERIAFALRTTMECYEDASVGTEWAINWLTGKDRTTETAENLLPRLLNINAIPRLAVRLIINLRDWPTVIPTETARIVLVSVERKCFSKDIPKPNLIKIAHEAIKGEREK